MNTVFRTAFTRAIPSHEDAARPRASLRLDPAGEIVSLRVSQLMRLEHVRGWTVQALAGCVWITQDGDVRDVVLEAGDTMVLDRDVPVLMSPLEDSRLRLVRHAGHAPGLRLAEPALSALPAHAAFA